MDRTEKDLMDALLKVQAGHEAEVESSFRHISENIFRHTMSPKEALGISNERIESLYAEGFKLFNSGNFKKALPYFESLTVLDGNDPRFVFALAATHHGLKHYREALSCYTLASQLDVTAPHPMFHAADCTLHLGDKVTAVVLLQAAIDRAGDKVAWSELKARAALTKDGLIAAIKGEEKK